MKRKIYDSLLKWKQEKQGTTALLIEGARRIGKSYIAVVHSGTDPIVHMFEVAHEEILRCQIVTSNWGGSRYGAFPA